MEEVGRKATDLMGWSCAPICWGRLLGGCWPVFGRNANVDEVYVRFKKVQVERLDKKQ